ncbi:hypothetical protein DFH28DRAFT_1189146 [Melampsora americana]|nr:hypothetical protein DFH28DRAFT_1189146 [Melampsora americana]
MIMGLISWINQYHDRSRNSLRFIRFERAFHNHCNLGGACGEYHPVIHLELARYLVEALKVEGLNEFQIPLDIMRHYKNIDDTIKSTNVLSGMKTVLRNVFLHKFEEVKVTGMSSWYQSLSSLAF